MRNVIALEKRLARCRNVTTLGVKPNFADYAPDARSLIRRASVIYYPSAFYVDHFDAMGKRTFPSYHTYKCVQDKIKQTTLFNLLKIPHPRTRLFYGKRQKGKITDYFKFPFVAKIPRGSALGRGVFLIRGAEDLEMYANLTHTAYIQVYLPIDRDIRVVVIGQRAVHAYWRVAPKGEFRTNLAVGGEIKLDNVPEKAVALAVDAARQCGWDDVGIDVCLCGGRYYILEANMKYGKAGFREAGMDYHKLMERLIEERQI